MTDGHSASLSWNKACIWGLWPDFYYCQTVAGLLMWGALSNKRTGLMFAIFAVPRQRTHSLVPVPWDSWPYLTVSDLRLPFSSPPTTHRTMVEVFDPASKRGNDRVRVQVTLRLAVYHQSVRLGAEPLETQGQNYFSQLKLAIIALINPLWREDGSVVCNCCWPSPVHSFLDPSPVELMTMFYCLRFETSLFVASYGSQGYDGGIQPRLYTGQWQIQSQSYVMTNGSVGQSVLE
jgi:hypothetical protein